MLLPYPKHHFVKEGHQTSCQVCNSKKIHLILDLGHQPLSDTLLTESALNQPEKTYPLRMMWCQECTLVQLDFCVPGSEVYHPDYPFRSGITKEVAEYQKNISQSLIKKYNLTSKDLVVDIGCNDGTLLKGFRDMGIRVLGVEPTNIARISKAQGIETIQAFFDIKLAKEIKLKYGAAALVITTNTFAHMQTLGEFISGAHILLKEDGVFINETHYLLDVIQSGQFDTFYHEHLRTYSLKAYIKLFKPYDFTVTDVERGDRYGGNIRVYATKGKGRRVNPLVNKLLKLEAEFGFDKLSTYEKFAMAVKKARFEFMDFLIKAKKKGKIVVGDSCPARASTLLNYYGVDKELIAYITEQPTSLKLNMYLPGKHLPIVNNERLIKEQPDCVVILAWHLAKPIMKRLKERGLKSDFIIPLPSFRVVINSAV